MANASEFFESLGKSISRTADRVVKKTDEFVAIQKIKNQISSLEQKIDRDFILQCTSEAVDEQVAAFQYIYSSLTENQAVLLHAIACEHAVKEPLGGEFSQRYRLPAKSSLRLALDYLVRNQLVYRDMQRGYVVYDKFMDMWLASL